MSKNRGLRWVYTVSLGCACLALILLALLVNAQIVSRLFGVIIPSADELSVYLLAASIFLAAGPAMRRAFHIRVGLLLQRSSLRAGKAMDAACHVVGMVVAAYLTYFVGEMAWDSYRFGSLSTGLYPTALWKPQLLLFSGSAVLLLAFSEGLIEVLQGKEQSGGAGDDSRQPAGPSGGSEWT